MTIPAPKTNYDWAAYDSKKNPVSCHVECTYDARTGCWSELRAIDSPWLQVHGLAPGLHYGQQAFEGLLARRTASNDILIFRPRAHAARFARSAAAVSMPVVPETLFVDAVHMAVSLNAQHVPPHDFPGGLYIRPFQFGSGPQIGLDPPDEFAFCVFVQTLPASPTPRPVKALIAEHFDRAAPRGTGSFKVGGNYAPVVRWTAEAKKEGWDILLHLDSITQTYIDEFSLSAFIGIKAHGPISCDSEHDEGSVRPKVILGTSPSALESITAGSVAELARSFGWTVEKRAVKLEEVSEFSEVLAVGTASGLVPLSCIRHHGADRTFHFSSNGPCFIRLREAFEALCRGKVQDQFGWCQKLRYSDFRTGHKPV